MSLVTGWRVLGSSSKPGYHGHVTVHWEEKHGGGWFNNWSICSMAKTWHPRSYERPHILRWNTLENYIWKHLAHMCSSHHPRESVARQATGHGQAMTWLWTKPQPLVGMKFPTSTSGTSPLFAGWITIEWCWTSIFYGWIMNSDNSHTPQGQLFLGSPCGWLSRSSPWKQSQPTSDCQLPLISSSQDAHTLRYPCPKSDVLVNYIYYIYTHVMLCVYIYIHYILIYVYDWSVNLYVYIYLFTMCLCVHVLFCMFIHVYVYCMCLTHTRQISAAKAPRESN